MATGGIIVVGDEILSGHIYDANSSYLVRRLSDLGIEVSSVCIVPDRIEAIVDRLADSLRKQDITLTSGGLGPTPDDLTKVAAARLLGRRLAIDETTADHIETLYARSGHRPPPSSAKQALVPQGSIVLENPIGLAPGLILVEGRRCLILLPGVPLELQRVFEAGVVPFIEEKYGSSPGPAVLIRTTGLPESEIVDLVSPV
ncbi:MAG: competence/damage-inducible protein A, partial [candidate division WOR-3 bacterium]